MFESQGGDEAIDRLAGAAGLSLSTLAPGDCFFASPSAVRRGWSQGALTWKGAGTRDRIAAQFPKALAAGIERPVMFGALPFDAQEEGFFIWPSRRFALASSMAGDAPGGRNDAAAGPGRLRSSLEVPSADGYRSAVREALARIGRGPLDKVVLARTLDVELDAALDHGALLRALWARNRKGYTFALPLASPDSAGGETPMWMGASPELLVRREGRRIHVNPLAGSVPRRLRDTEADAGLASGLLHSEKDLREHAIVVREIERILRPFCLELSVPGGPSLVSTDTLWHLSTEIEGVLAEPAPTALELARALHPTPAICGHPTGLARQAIGELEAFEREYYSGLVGWQDESGDGEWALALRCARARGRRLRLYAGAGIVAGSDPQSEYVETATKLATLLGALCGLPPDAARAVAAAGAGAHSADDSARPAVAGGRTRTSRA